MRNLNGEYEPNLIPGTPLRCANCHQPGNVHVKLKCVFGPGTLEPVCCIYCDDPIIYPEFCWTVRLELEGLVSIHTGCAHDDFQRLEGEVSMPGRAEKYTFLIWKKARERREAK